jgi:NAD(P)-dependent dehydrogenase (short-subunit alcohol dehydrogenase family)
MALSGGAELRPFENGGARGTPADIGNAVSLLCSEEAGWITDQLIAVDGGSSLMDPGLPLEIQQAVRKAAKSEAA